MDTLTLIAVLVVGAIILWRIETMRADIQALKTSLEQYIADVNAWAASIAESHGNIDEKIKAAIEADDLEESKEIQEVQKMLDEARGKLQAPPAPPVFEPSNL